MDQAQRLLSTSAAQSYLSTRVAGWFGAAYEGTQPLAAHPLGAEMLNEETQRLIHAILFEAQDSVARLLDADYTFVTPELAEWYQLPPVPAGWSRVSLEGTRRRGLLHHASWLGRGFEAAYVRYPVRGGILLKVICKPLPPEPAISPLPESLEPEVWTDSARRERESLIAQELECSACHSMLNSIAFAFDKYDGWGQDRATFDSGQPIDTAGELYSYDFTDSADLVTQLAAGGEYMDCFRNHWLGELAWIYPDHRDNAQSLESYLAHSERTERFLDLVLQFVGSEHYVNRYVAD